MRPDDYRFDGVAWLAGASRGQAGAGEHVQPGTERFDRPCATAQVDALKGSGLLDLAKGTTLPEVEEALRRFGTLVSADDPLARECARRGAVDHLCALGISTPARLVDAALKGTATQGKEAGQGRPLDLADPDPWPEAVDGAGLLEELAATFGRFIVLPAGAAEICALWVAHTFAFDAFDHTGYLAVTSPVKRCGKSTLLRLINAISRRALSADNVSPAALWRVVEENRPTLLIDEVDRLPRDSDLWGVLNSGHAVDGAVLRTVGDDHEPRRFSTFCPKVLGYIRGNRNAVPDTVEDRSIRIVMQRRAPGEKREKLRTRALDALAVPLRRKLARWTQDTIERFREVVECPEALDDRAADSWEPLLTVADAAGGDWPEVARALAVRFSTERSEEDSETPGIAVLADLKGLLASGEHLGDEEGLSGEDACRLLCGLPDRPWRNWGRAGDGLTPTGLARLLKPFGLRSALVGPERRRVRRYPLDALRDAFARFVPCPPERVPSTRTPAQDAEALRITPLESTACAAERLSGLLGTERVETPRGPAQTGFNGASVASAATVPAIERGSL